MKPAAFARLIAILLFVPVLALYAASPSIPVAHDAPGVPVMSAASFVDSLAVNTRIAYSDTAYADAHKVADDLAWLGIRHIRDAMPSGAIPVSTYVWMAERGIRFDFVVVANVDEAMKQLDSVNAAAPGSIAAVEGFNEIDNFPVQYKGMNGNPAGIAGQKAIYAHVHGNPAFAGVPVYDLTGYDIKPVSSRAGSADFANAHFYPQDGQQPAWNAGGGAWLSWGIDGMRKFGLPLVVTEFGYGSMPQAGWNVIGVDEPTQAKGVLNGLLDAASAGVTRTYIYELLDERPDPGFHNGLLHFGLLRNDHTPKPAATAIHNLTTILGAQRAGKTADAVAIPYTLSDLPVSGRSLLLQKDDGRYVLVLWNEVPIWDRATGKPIESPPVNVQLGLGKTAARVDVYDPTVSASPLTSRRDVRGLSVSVPDHPVMIEMTFEGGPSA